MLKLSPVFKKNAAALKDDFRYIINQGGTSCFAPSTLVNTQFGYKKISDIKKGDLVLSYNEKNNCFEYKKVINTFCYKNYKETYKVNLKNNKFFIATSDHKFFIEGGCISLKSMLQSCCKQGVTNERDMENNTQFQPLRSVKFGKNKVNELQKLKQNKSFKTCNSKRWLLSNNVIKRFRKIQELESSQICCNDISRGNREQRSQSYRRKQTKQFYAEFRNSNKIRKYFARLQSWAYNSQERFFKREFKINRKTSKRNTRSCPNWRQILWKKTISRKIWCFGMLYKRDCQSKKEYLARCLSINDILNYELYNEPVVFDIEVEQNHNYVINAGKDILVHNSTKTFSILQLLVTLSLKYKVKIDIVGLSVPHLKTGVLNDMPDVCSQFGIDFYKCYKSSDKIFKAGKGAITFLSFDKLGSAHGGRRDFLYLNEANHQHYNIVEQLLIRTRKNIFIDYNPTNEFWVHEKIFKDEPQKATLIKSTYKDNPFLEQTIIDSIEARKGDNNFWRVYGLGELGIAEGLVFENFEVADFDKNRFSKYRYGIDWGFSNDPFAFVECAIEQNRLYICNEIYQTKLLNKESSELVKKYVKNERIICDSAEPKSVQEYQSYGLNAVAAKKGKGSVLSGLKYMQQFDKIIIHPSCTNAIAEFKNYQYKRDKNGDFVNDEPVDAFNHLIDAIRYSLEDEMNFNTTRIVGMRPF